MGVFKYEIYRQYPIKMDINDLAMITEGQTIARGTGYYPDIDKDGEIHWEAVKGFGHNDFTIYWISSKQPYMTTQHNGEKLMDLKVVQELLNCTDEVLERYRL
jgi:hypothetical protein